MRSATARSNGSERYCRLSQWANSAATERYEHDWNGGVTSQVVAHRPQQSSTDAVVVSGTDDEHVRVELGERVPRVAVEQLLRERHASFVRHKLPSTENLAVKDGASRGIVVWFTKAGVHHGR